MTIKARPEDFRVHEIVQPAWLAALGKAGAYAVFRLEKKGLTTPEALAQFRKKLGLKPGAVEYAGLKDKHAWTAQLTTVRADALAAAALIASAAKSKTDAAEPAEAAKSSPAHAAPSPVPAGLAEPDAEDLDEGLDDVSEAEAEADELDFDETEDPTDGDPEAATALPPDSTASTPTAPSTAPSAEPGAANAAAKPFKSPGHVEGERWKARRIGWSNAPLDAQAIVGNRFDVVVRSLTRRRHGSILRLLHHYALPLENPASEVVNEAPLASDAVNIAASEIATGPSAAQPAEPPRIRAGRPATVLMTNYFGSQRFGSSRANRRFLAPLLIRGSFEPALKLAIATPTRKDAPKLKRFKRALAEGWRKWDAVLPNLPDCPERRAVEHLAGNPRDYRGAFAELPYFYQQICVEAYQSWLWNRIAARWLLQSSGMTAVKASDADLDDTAMPADVRIVADLFCDLVFLAPHRVTPELRAASLPLLGPETKLEGPWAEHAKAVLAQERLEVAELTIPGLRRPYFGEAWRPLFIEAKDVRVSHPQPDELSSARDRRFKLSLHFDLPRGAYATILLRALGQ